MSDPDSWNASDICWAVAIAGESAGTSGTGCSRTTWVSDGNVKYRVATSATHAPMTISGRRTTKSPSRWDADRGARDAPAAAFREWVPAAFP
ncbi:MAG: hypothetical protein ACXVX6_13425 [Mycobacterium sp.]